MDIISAYATKLLLDYTESCGILKQSLLTKSNVPATVLFSDSRWLSFADWSVLLTAVCKELYRDPYYVGYHATMWQNNSPTKQTKVLRLLPFPLLKAVLPHIIKRYINKNLNSVLSQTDDHIILTISPENITLYTREFCEYNRGVCAAIMDIRLKWTGSVVRETTCIMKGDLCCTYVMDKVFGEVDTVSESMAITSDDIDYLFRGAVTT